MPQAKQKKKRAKQARDEPKMHDAYLSLKLLPHGFQLDLRLDGCGTGGYCFDFGDDIDPIKEGENVAELILRRYGRSQFFHRRTLPQPLKVEVDDALTAVTAAVHFGYNASFDEFAAVYGGLTGSESRHAYLKSKFDMMKGDIGAFIGQLDGEHRRRFVELALIRYAEKG